jgi:exopolyphosphatase/guanosine-5'-triphosphate,3'-diphosphate pyrophosphatase
MPAQPPRERPPSPTPNLLSALHIGAASVSLMIAERGADGTIQPLDVLEKPAPVARDIFRRGVLQRGTIEQIVTIVGDYQKSLLENGLDPHQITRAVATNILSEAANHETVLNRVRIACGIRVTPIDDGEMTRLIYLKTRRRLGQMPALRQRATLVVHVGPGNTRALLFQDGLITRYTSYRMGAHRSREAVDGSHAEGPALLRVVREDVSGNLAQIALDCADVPPNAIILIGTEIQSVAAPLTRRQAFCTVKRLRQFVMETATLSEVEAVKRFHLDYQTAEALLPALEINLAIAEALDLAEVHIPATDYEQGLLHDLLLSRNLTADFAGEVLRSARILAERYQSDPRHGSHVAELCARFFGELADLHQLTAHDALLLQVAAILHEVGTYISPRAHHKHSEYIILNSEIFGLDRLDVTLVALVARYHRHSGPRLDHTAYAAMSADDRIRICKLAAILRVADALERTHRQRVSEIEIRREPGRLRLRLPAVADAAVERLAMASKGDLFEQTFGLTVTIDEGG